MSEISKVTPTNVTQLSFDLDHVYDPVEWKDGITPINQKNLNKSEQALYTLLADNDTYTGYIQSIIEQLNQEILARVKDVNNLSDVSSDLNGELVKTNNDLSDLFSRLYDPTTGDIIVLNKNVSSNYTSIEDIKTSLSTLIIRISQIENLTSNTDIVVSLKKAIQDLSSLENKLYNIQTGDITELNKICNSLESSVVKLRQDIDLIINNGSVPSDVIISGDDVYLNCGTSATVLH